MKQSIKWLLPVCFFVFAATPVFAQSNFIFKDRKIINSFSTETLPKRVLDFRIAHRFGDMFGDNGGWETLYGLENARDILIGFDYGATDRLLVGVNRTKGAGPLRMLVNTYFKYKLAGQYHYQEKPVAVSFLAMASISTMPKSDESSAINYFEKFVHRLTYHFQMIVAKRFSDGFSFQFNVGYTHRNIVNLDDDNYLLNAGVASRIQFSRRLALLLECNAPIRFKDTVTQYTIPLGTGLEWETGGGHVFQINITNAGGLNETDYLPYTRSVWDEGEFRLGFTISRKFKL